MQEIKPLVWPEGWPRTLIKDREGRRVWKKTLRQSIEVLEKEMKMFEVTSSGLALADYDVTRNPSVVVSFSRKQHEDTSWQMALQIANPEPSQDEINAAFKRLSLQHHPDRGGDLETYLELEKHKRNALAYINRGKSTAFEYVIACDKYREPRWNVMAIAGTFRSLRQMERDGTSRMVERAMTGFAAQLPQEAGRSYGTASVGSGS